MRDALIGFMAATVQAQAATGAWRAGIDYAKFHEDVYLGRKPSFTTAQCRALMDGLSAGQGVTTIAAATGLWRQTVYRIKAEVAEAERSLAQWSRTSSARPVEDAHAPAR